MKSLVSTFLASHNDLTRGIMKCLVGSLCLLLVGCARAQSPSVAIRDVIVVDVRDGSLHPDHTVLVEGNRIAAVGPTHQVDVPGDAVIM
jgi:hypothetical protein